MKVKKQTMIKHVKKKSAAEKIKMRKWFSGEWWYLSKDLGR